MGGLSKGGLPKGGLPKGGLPKGDNLNESSIYFCNCDLRPLMTSDDFGRFLTYLPTQVRFGPIWEKVPIL